MGNITLSNNKSFMQKQDRKEDSDDTNQICWSSFRTVVGINFLVIALLILCYTFFGLLAAQSVENILNNLPSFLGALLFSTSVVVAIIAVLQWVYLIPVVIILLCSNASHRLRGVLLAGFFTLGIGVICGCICVLIFHLSPPFHAERLS